MNFKKLAISTLLVTSVLFNTGLTFGQADYKNQHEAYSMKVEKITTDKLYLYDVKHKEKVVIDFYCEKSDMKNFKNATFYYNYKDDILFMVKNGILYDMNYGL